MPRSLAAALRRSSRLLHPVKLVKTAHAMQQAMTGLMTAGLISPFAAVATKPARPRKAKVGKSLGIVLTQLRAAKSLMPGAQAGSAPGLVRPRQPTGAQFLTRKHRCAAGSRGYRLYLPASHPKRPKGLIVMLHGCNQTPEDFATGTHMNALAERHGLAVAYPAQTLRDNMASCWNWFRPGDQRRGAGEPAILASLARKLMREFALGRETVFVAGLSAGGAMAAVLADVYPDVFSAAGVHSGLARGAATNALSAMLAMRNGGTPDGIVSLVVHPASPVRRIVFQGDRDSTVDPSNATAIISAALGDAAGASKTTRRAVRGRGYVRSEFTAPDGEVLLEYWLLKGAGHAWSGGRAGGSYTDIAGPDASAEMVRFFLAVGPGGTAGDPVR